MPRILLTIAALAVLAQPEASAYLIKLKPVYITSYQTGGSSGAPLPTGRYELQIKGDDDDWPGQLRGSLSRSGRTWDFPLTVSNCRNGRTRARGEFRPRRGSRHIELRITAKLKVPGSRTAKICDIRGDLPLTGSVQEPPHDRPGFPGPDQLGAGGRLPNLRIRSAKPVGSSATKLEVQVINSGAGPSAATQLKFIYFKDGKSETASAAVPALAANQKASITVGGSKPVAEADKIGLRADDPDIVAETSEKDNSFIYTP